MKKLSQPNKKQSPASRAREILSEINAVYETEVLSDDSEEEESETQEDDVVSIESQSDESADEEDLYEEYCVECSPVVPDTFAGTRLSAKGRCCQICQFEGRGVQQSHVVTCKAHRVRVCADISVHPPKMVDWILKYYKLQAEDLKWFCPNRDLTCWEKLHHFYVPNGLFPALRTIQETNMDEKKKEFFLAIKSSKMYKARNNSIKLYEDKTGCTFEDSQKRKELIKFSEPTANNKKHKANIVGVQKKIAVLQQKEQKKMRDVAKARVQTEVPEKVARGTTQKATMDRAEKAPKGGLGRSSTNTLPPNKVRNNDDLEQKYDKLLSTVLLLSEKLDNMATAPLATTSPPSAAVGIGTKTVDKCPEVNLTSPIELLPTAIELLPTDSQLTGKTTIE